MNPAVEVEQLREALRSQPVIEQAKGMLMLLRGWTGDQAFTGLREVSQHTNVKLHDVAAVIVAAGSKAGPAAVDEATKEAVLKEVRRRVLGEGFGVE
ncbi:ANTAR domain-containing protein [Amycolatopsis sp. NPDC051102]|uniref:ANTAR domain-containing protein n=1 Tax=Amycolatopsis sp. NPDC051102 TaxID=3155163 RepID=UPI00342F0E51